MGGYSHADETGDKSGTRFFAMRFAEKGFLALFLLASCATALHAQTIQIELVNGKTGRSITDSSKLHVWVGKVSGSGTLIIPTDKHGVAMLRLTHNDSEINVPECKGMQADLKKLQTSRDKKDKEEFNKKYEGCFGFEVKSPIARYADTLTVNTSPGDVSWRVGSAGQIAYVPCWVNTKANKYSWLSTTDFSTEGILQHGIVTANACGKATASPRPGHLVLFVRLPSNRETWRQAWN